MFVGNAYITRKPTNLFHPLFFNFKDFVSGCFRIIFLCFFILFSSVVISYANWSVKVDGIVTKEAKRVEGAIVTLITLRKGSQEVHRVTTPSNGKFIFILYPNKDYLIVASKPGLITKKIIFSTKNVPAGKVGKGFPPFPIEITLFEDFEGLDISILDKPVGRVIYSEKINNFDIDKEYAKSIRAQMAKLMRELNARRKETEKAKRTRVKRLIKARRSKPEEFIVERRYKAERSAKEKVAAEKTVREKRAREKTTAKAALEIAARVKAKERATLKAATSNKKHTTILNKAGKTITAKAKIEPERKNSILKNYVFSKIKPPGIKSQLALEYPEGVTEEHFKKGNKEIIRRIVVKDGQADEYRVVFHPWGAVFYFKNGLSITKFIFDTEADLKL